MSGEEELAPETVQEDGVVAPETQAPELTETQAPPSVDDLATEMGWTPQDKWRGEPDKWKPADEFVRNTVSVNRGLSQHLKDMKSQLDVMARTSATLTEQAVAKARDETLRDRERAFEEGDKEAFQAADKKLAELQVAPIEAGPPTQEGRDFAERHAAWYGKDQEATAFASRRTDELAKMGLSPARQIAAVEREMQQFFPDLVTPAKEEPRPKPVTLNKPGTRATTAQTKGFSSLPPEAQAVALDYKKRMGLDPEDYAKTYYEQGAGA